MTYGRDGDVLYLHGAVGNAMLRASAGAEVCVTITLLDGLVLARSRLPPLDELPLGGAARRGTQGGGRRREAPRLRLHRRARAHRAQPRSRDRPTTPSCARRSCSRSRSRRARPRSAPAAPSTTRRTWTSPCGPASSRSASSRASPSRTAATRPAPACPVPVGRRRGRGAQTGPVAAAEHLVLALGRGAGHALDGRALRSARRGGSPRRTGSTGGCRPCAPRR